MGKNTFRCSGLFEAGVECFDRGSGILLVFKCFERGLNVWPLRGLGVELEDDTVRDLKVVTPRAARCAASIGCIDKLGPILATIEIAYPTSTFPPK